MKCAQCQLDYDEDDLVYNDYIGGDVCDDCDLAGTEEEEADREMRDDESPS
jgi:hypothetical protein